MNGVDSRIIIGLERRRRILISVAAYAYEFESDSIISDADFDDISRMIDVSRLTGRPNLDKFFRENFSPCTGMWVHRHPDKAGLMGLYNEVKAMRDSGEKHWIFEGMNG